MKSLVFNHSIARRLQVGVGIAAGLVLGITVWFNYWTSRAELEQQTNDKALSESRAAATRVDDFIARIGMLARGTASRQQVYGRDPDPDMVPLMAQFLAQMPKDEVYGLAMAFEHKDWRDADAMPWVDRKSWPNKVELGYDYHDPKWEWYAGPKTSRQFYVTEPYFDDGGSEITMVTLSVPMVDSASEFFGVATVDLSLDRLRAMVRAARLSRAAETGRNGADEFAYLVSRAGRIIAHPNEELMLGKGFPGEEVKNLPGGEAVAAQPEGFTEATQDGKRRRVYWATSPLTGWKVVLNVSEADILAPVRQLMVRSALIGVVGLLVLVVVVTAIARRLAHPLLDLTRTATAIEQGNFREEHLGLLPQRQDELGELAKSFQTMARTIQALGQSLAELNENLERTVGQRTAELTARAGELEELTRQFQESAALESSLSALNTSLRGNLTVAEVAQRGLADAIRFLQAPMGAMFVADREGRFHRMAVHAYPDSIELPQSFALGVGIVGQAAQSGQPIVTQTDVEKLRVQFGFAAVPPSDVATYPLLANDSPVGVLELCLFKPLAEAQARWLEKATETMANALRFAMESEERKRAEVRTRLILDSSSEGIFGVDTEGTIGFVNPSACRMLGYSAEELIGAPSHSLIHHHRPDGSEYPMSECPMYAAYRRGEASRIDDEFLWRKDGTGLPVEYGATPIHKDGIIVGAVVSFTDITERRRGEQQLHQAKFLSDIALELTECGYWHVDYSDPDYYYQSERAARIVGEEPRADGRYHLQNEWFSRLVEADPELAKAAAEKYQGAIEGKYDSYDATYAYKRPSDGRIVWLHAAGSVDRGEDGKVRYMYGVYQDITKAKKAELEIIASERRIRETEQFFRSVLELAPDGLMVVGSDGTIQLANAEAEKLFGYTGEELIGQPVEILVPDDVRPYHPALRDKFHANSISRDMGATSELFGLRKDSSLFPVEIGLSPLPKRGEIEQVAVSIRDISARKQQEDALREAKSS